MAKDFLEIDDDLYVDPNTGDFGFGEADDEYLRDIMVSYPGEYKQTPYIGVGIADYLNAPFNKKIAQDLEKTIRLNIESSGAKENTIEVTVDSNGNVSASAKYD